MGKVVVDPETQTVRLRGIAFDVSDVRAAMLETGGIVVSDRDLNRRLDRAVMEYKALSGKEPEALLTEIEPGFYFVPRRIRIHRGRFDVKGTDSLFYLYFAVRRQYNV